MKKFIVFFLITILALTFAYSQAPEKPKITVPLSFDYYYTNDMVNEALKVLNNAYPDLTKLDVVGKSDEGRTIYALTVNNPKTVLFRDLFSLNSP